jgi:hypothetical protein
MSGGGDPGGTHAARHSLGSPTATTVAALYVATGGCYYGLEGVDPWDAARDARLYAGPWPVVAHPPCERWGRYWSGGPNPSSPRRELARSMGGRLRARVAGLAAVSTEVK